MITHPKFVCVYTTDLDATFADLTARGVAFATEPAVGDWDLGNPVGQLHRPRRDHLRHQRGGRLTSSGLEVVPSATPSDEFGAGAPSTPWRPSSDSKPAIT